MRSKSRDEGRLAELGYKQELKRDWSMLHNFGVSFSIIVSAAHASSDEGQDATNTPRFASRSSPVSRPSSNTASPPAVRAS